MTWTKTVEDANEYFLPSNHIKSYSWRKYNKDDKVAAFAQAVRVLQASQGREMEDPDSDDDTYRDDYAVYEQALFILENTPRQLSGGVPNVVNLVDDNNDELERKGVLISPDAAMYFAMNRIHLVRG